MNQEMKEQNAVMEPIRETWMLSHPMSGIPEEEVIAFRKEVIEAFTKGMIQKGIAVEFIDNYHHENLPENATRIEHLAESIRRMKDVKHVIFCGNWWESKGCWVELEICKQYGIRYSMF